jgi:hypothetical protein
MEITSMIEFSLSIDLGKRGRIIQRAPDHRSLTVDRAFVARALIDLGAELHAVNKERAGAIKDETGAEIGSWEFALSNSSD